VRAYAQLIGSYIGAPYFALGTDGFGRSDTRTALRRFFEVDRWHIAAAALASVDRAKHAEALARYGIATEPGAPWTR
jgi:pyruvate dehydrogenase E1 component